MLWICVFLRCFLIHSLLILFAFSLFRMGLLPGEKYLAAANMKNILLFLLLCISFPAIAQERDSSTASFPEEPGWEIERIDIEGAKKTKERIILREMSIREGQQVEPGAMEGLLRDNWKRLFNMGLFTEINLRADTAGPFKLHIKVTLRERWYIIPEPTFQLADRNFNVWWTEQNRDFQRTIIGVTMRYKNFTGNMDLLSVTVQGGYTQKIFVDYMLPYVDKKQKHGVGFSFGYAESGEMFYATDSNKLKFIKITNRFVTNQWEGSIAYVYRPAYAACHIFRLGYKHYQVADTVIKLNPGYYEHQSKTLNLLELSYRLELNKADNWQYPLTGTKFIGQVFFRQGLKGLDHQLGGTVEAGRYLPLGGKWYGSTIFRGRLMGPGQLPYALRGALGTKYEYVRGYEYYVIDGYQYGILRANLKYELLRLNIRKLPFRYLPIIPLRVYPKIFADAGYVQLPPSQAGNSYLNNRVLYSAGIGLDIFTAYDIKIRFEYAWNHLGQKGLFLHFNSE